MIKKCFLVALLLFITNVLGTITIKNNTDKFIGIQLSLTHIGSQLTSIIHPKKEFRIPFSDKNNLQELGILHISDNYFNVFAHHSSKIFSVKDTIKSQLAKIKGNITIIFPQDFNEESEETDFDLE